MTMVMYSVKVWIDPDKGREYMGWLTGGHVAEVASAPGVLWAHLMRLDENAPDGWLGYQAIYAFENRQALINYQNSDMFRSFAPIWRQHADVFRLERQIGNIIESHDRKIR